ncbi:heme utilization cystosolic carrier protein HutX [Polycladidibacter stylochi]|uniref:heme utilization cystosolic carrier protein HutX n=1 Tax=Polycladidibacter stylochi TaxID=1807766 RepID=UPI0008372BC1|nr:heme utilization cystosolic carrier protein HutX [Pseudovibrio stylochi]
MTETTTKLKEILAEKPDAFLEALAEEHQVSMQAVLHSLPEGLYRAAAGEHFMALMEDLPNWGTMRIICSTPDMVYEVASSFPEGSVSRGFYNLKSTNGFSGHIKEDACKEIGFLRRPFFGKETACIMLLNAKGDCYLKVFLGRNEDRSLKQDQLEKLEALCEKFAANYPQ